MASDSKFEVRLGAPGNVLEVRVGTVEVDVPRSVGYFGGLAAAVGLGLIEPPLALFIAAVPLYKVLTNSVLPRPVRAIGEVLEGAAKPVGSDAEGVIQLEDQQEARTRVVGIDGSAPGRRSASSPSRPTGASQKPSSATRTARKTPAKRSARRADKTPAKRSARAR
jgi:hypothetical protein